MTLIIREAVERDADIVYRLILALSRHENTQQYVLTNTEKLREQGFGKDKKFGALLAEHDGKTAGYLTYTWNYSTWGAGEYMYIENVFILEQYRRLGFGAALMQEARAICEQNGCRHIKWEVQSENEVAIAFYRKQGATVSFRGICSCTL